jgi:hypothetical protein
MSKTALRLRSSLFSLLSLIVLLVWFTLSCRDADYYSGEHWARLLTAYEAALTTCLLGSLIIIFEGVRANDEK